MERRDDPERDVAHVVQDVVVGDIPGADQFDAALVESPLGELLHENRAHAGGNEHEHRVRCEIVDLLQKWRKVGIAQRHAQRIGYFAA